MAGVTAVAAAGFLFSGKEDLPVFRAQVVTPSAQVSACGPQDAAGRLCAPTFFLDRDPPPGVPLWIRITSVERPARSWALEPGAEGVVRCGPLTADATYEITCGAGCEAPAGGEEAPRGSSRVVLEGSEIHGRSLDMPDLEAYEVPDGYLVVRVMDPNGWTVAGARIILEGIPEQELVAAGNGMALVPTSAAGRSYRVEPPSDDPYLAGARGRIRNATPPVTLSWTGEAQVRVNATGAPEDGVEVLLFREPRYLPTLAFSGRFRVPFGRYRICARSGAFITPMEPVTLEDDEITLSFAGWHRSTVRMKVLDPRGAPLTGLALALTERSWRLARLPRFTSTHVPWLPAGRGTSFPDRVLTIMGRTQDDGVVEFQGVPPGIYEAVVAGGSHQLSLLVEVPELCPGGVLDVGPVAAAPATGILTISLEDVQRGGIVDPAVDAKSALTALERLELKGSGPWRHTGLPEGVYSLRLMGRRDGGSRRHWLCGWTTVHLPPGGEVGVVLDPR